MWFEFRVFLLRDGWWYMESVRCPDYMASLIGLTDKTDRNTGHYSWGGPGCTSCRKVSVLTASRLRGCPSCRKVVNFDSIPPSGLHSGISVWISFRGLFRVLDISVRKRGFRNSVLLPFDEFHSRALEMHLPEIVRQHKNNVSIVWLSHLQRSIISYLYRGHSSL